MRQGSSLELAALDQANFDPFCYKRIIICEHNLLEILANPLQFFFFIHESILLGKTEVNPAFIIYLMLPLC